MMQSPSGKRVVEASGPLSASLVLVSDSPDSDAVESGIYTGRAGEQLNIALRHAGVDRGDVRILYTVPVQPAGDKFARHDPADIVWAREGFRDELAKLTNAKVFVPMGPHATEWLLGGRLPISERASKGDGFINQWRGSVLPVSAFKCGFVDGDLPPLAPEDYLHRIELSPPAQLSRDAIVVPTFRPEDILKQMAWHPWLLVDIAKAAKVLRDGLPTLPRRRWYFQDLAALERLAAQDPREYGQLLSVDSELDPQIVGLATDEEVHVFEATAEFLPALKRLMANATVIKIAHNWTHDYAFLRKAMGIKTARPIYDTQGGAHILNTALQKELSPHISTRFTDWPHHKWLDAIDKLLYCGLDAVVSYDAYWPQMDALHKRKLFDVAVHDHRLLTPLMEMTATGFLIDETERLNVEQELRAQLERADAELQQLVEPIVEKRIAAFEKPHLFRVLRKCGCCGGGSTQAHHCLECYFQSLSAEDQALQREVQRRIGKDGWIKHAGIAGTAKAFKAALPQCRTCGGTGKVTKKLEFNSESSDQIADVIYRGLGIRPRKFKGVETVKAAQLEPLRDRHIIIDRLVNVSVLRAEFETVERLQAGPDGCLHCIFDPFGTGSGRVASKEGLVEPGTNAQNLPRLARRFIVARPGFIFMQPDMAQIEARVVAVLSKDAKLIEAFTKPIDWPGNPKHGVIDSHTRVVQLMLASGVQITRDQAKRLTYAAMYGGGAAQIAKELNAEAFRKGETLRLTEKQVQFMLDTFFRVFSGVKKWQVAVIDEVVKTRRLKNPLTGREFTWLGYIYDKKTKSLKYEIMKQVWSRLPQDTAAYILALGLNAMYYESGEWGKLLIPVQHGHDALLIETPIDRLEEGKALATKLLTRELWGISFPAEMKTGLNWYTASGGA